MKKLVIASLTSYLLFSNIAAAVEWIPMSESAEGNVFYVNPDTTRITGNMISGWIKIQKASNKFDLSYSQFDCVNMRWKLQESHEYIKGHNTNNFSGGLPWQSIIPDSACHVLWENMCKLWAYGKQTGNSTSRFRVE